MKNASNLQGDPISFHNFLIKIIKSEEALCNNVHVVFCFIACRN